jgi:hypothetical protein
MARKPSRWRVPCARERGGETSSAARDRAPREFVCVDHEPFASVIEKRQTDWDSGAGHLPAIIKPKIVRHTIILSANYLFLMPPTLSGQSANSAAINLSKFSFAVWYIPRDFLL